MEVHVDDALALSLPQELPLSKLEIAHQPILLTPILLTTMFALIQWVVKPPDPKLPVLFL